MRSPTSVERQRAGGILLHIIPRLGSRAFRVRESGVKVLTLKQFLDLHADGNEAVETLLDPIEPLRECLVRSWARTPKSESHYGAAYGGVKGDERRMKLAEALVPAGRII